MATRGTRKKGGSRGRPKTKVPEQEAEEESIPSDTEEILVGITSDKTLKRKRNTEEIYSLLVQAQKRGGSSTPRTPRNRRKQESTQKTSPSPQRASSRSKKKLIESTVVEDNYAADEQSDEEFNGLPNSLPDLEDDTEKDEDQGDKNKKKKTPRKSPGPKKKAPKETATEKPPAKAAKATGTDKPPEKPPTKSPAKSPMKRKKRERRPPVTFPRQVENILVNFIEAHDPLWCTRDEGHVNTELTSRLWDQAAQQEGMPEGTTGEFMNAVYLQ